MINFSKRCAEVAACDPVKDFAIELINSGMTEKQLIEMLSKEGLLPTPFKNNLHNKFRSQILVQEEKNGRD
jgi:hypothetical protein